MNSYQYSPLHARQIRLLTLQSGARNERLCIEIEHVDLFKVNGSLPPHRTPLFEALSYTWGDLNDTEEIIIQDTFGTGRSGLNVTHNLAAALRRLRYTNRPRTLWVDAVCINQTNLSERNEQVRQMVRVYSMAVRVLIYIGEEEKSSDLAMDAIADITGEVTHVKLSAVEGLLNRPWFERVWVIQEVARSKSAIVICGTRAVAWDCFTRWPTRQACLPVPDVTWADYIPGVLNYNSGFASSTGTEALLRTLCETRASGATDPRDKVFALLGLLSDEEQKTYGSLINYSTPVDRVYLDTALKMIFESKSLRVMSAVQHRMCSSPPDVLDDLPSWVPNWSRAGHVLPLGLGQQFVEPFNAGGRYCTAEIGSNGNLLLRGLRVAQVQRISNGPDSSSSSYRERDTVLQSGYELLATDGDFPLQAFLHVISATPPSAIESETGYTRDVITMEELEHLMADVDRQNYSRLQRRVMQYTYGRKLFIAGDFIGLGPETMQEDGLLVVLPGGPTPYILRPSPLNPHQFELVGECYVHGLMNCEALQHVREQLAQVGHIVPITGHPKCSAPLEWFIMDSGKDKSAITIQENT
ncbi:heterokaryon incompatibility protein-domain-containing protein [Paraphoma chrysanthemicola]|uniref:Heterokaryon incompatibility protein-domain-containing protein n=1 Tax=Paraphoma chrysanthemicola TaxID=798071 RepID=A0A8K0RFK3_9PLEO|nr:heterokaryon incompatibility protein-domain-containing protein [Paraphoma chrysanthemicola]